MFKWLKKLSFSIGSLNGGWFGFYFWPVTSFSATLKIGKYRFSIGKWQTDGSDPERFPMLNRVGWTYHSYYPSIQKKRVYGPATIWVCDWMTYYGYNFGQPWYFSFDVFPRHDGCKEPPEIIEKRNKQFAGYPGMDSAVTLWLKEYPEAAKMTMQEMDELRCIINQQRYQHMEWR